MNLRFQEIIKFHWERIHCRWKYKISTGKYIKAVGNRMAAKGIVFFPKGNDVGQHQ
jgi:hypothetical protein